MNFQVSALSGDSECSERGDDSDVNVSDSDSEWWGGGGLVPWPCPSAFSLKGKRKLSLLPGTWQPHPLPFLPLSPGLGLLLASLSHAFAFSESSLLFSTPPAHLLPLLWYF